MSRAEVFMAPGAWMVRFGLSLFDLGAGDIPHELFWGLSVLATLLFWGQTIKIVIALIRRFAGFDRQGSRG